MKTKVDFSLSQQFGVVERILFRLALNGYMDVHEWYLALPLFSDSVIANAIVHLVNQQLLSINVDSGIVSLSGPIKALLVACHDNEYDIDWSDSQVEVIGDNGVLIAGLSKEAIRNKELVLRELLPSVKLEFLIGSLDFIVYKSEEAGHE